MISAWARMCKIIGPGFVQYLPVVMGPLIQAASLKPEIAFVDCELKLISQNLMITTTVQYSQKFSPLYS